MATTLPDNAAPEARSWDIIVRLTHWGVALAILLNGLLTEEGGTVHIWIGYGALSLLALRLLWGVVGPEEARFSSFVPSLSAARAHVGDIRSGRHRVHRSHNPLGGLMVYALWATLAVVIATGIAMTGSPFKSLEGARSAGEASRAQHAARAYEGEDEDEGEEVLEEVHGAAANLLLILAAVHVAGVAFETRRAGNYNLIRRMTFGGHADR